MKELRRVLVSKAQLESRVEELGAAISRDYEGKELVLIGILKRLLPYSWPT
ncbi:hypothetical protein PAECIP111892_05583 [Paenibacillus auburnensis]|uniref:Hypoxanthine phosphoribosyltransferase n=1 Tax=Paenibacillus auburnensis TaxID=2905649 RepID=A0ABN8H6Q6_9BACL|nr:hypothetical protein [Paenibacillus auburnensis]CAH1225229.1 hypothetical protein PAECIP111892_05583 [Paenibacillus auburnensis]